MKKIIAVALFLIISLVTVSHTAIAAMSLERLEALRIQMREKLDNTPEVTWYDLKNNEMEYVGKVVKFRAVCVGTNDPAAYLQDTDGNKLIIIRTSYYKLKLDTEYLISAQFKRMYTPEGDTAGAIFSIEDAHLPFMSEYGL